MKNFITKWTTGLTAGALLTGNILNPAVASAAKEVASSGGSELNIPVILVILAALALCGVVIVIVNGRSKRK